MFKNIYKSIVYFFFSLIYPLPSKIRKPKKEELFIKKIDKISYKIFKIKNARLYTDSVHVCGLIKNQHLIDGPSYQFINNNLSNIKKNKILKIGTPRKLFYFKGKILSFLSGGGANNNYFHWLYDVLPRLHLFKSFQEINKINYFLFPNLDLSFQRETLRLLNIDKKKCLSSIHFRHISADQIIVSNHPYVLNFNSTYGSEHIPNWINLWLKKNFLRFSSEKYRYEKIYIDRKITNAFNERRILNNNEIKNFLINEGFKILYLENYNFKDQISIFRNAKIIVGLHGAAFANMVFCKKNTKIIELLNNTTGPQIKNLAKQNNLKYSNVFGSSKYNTNHQNSLMNISLNSLKKKLNNLIKAG